MRSGVRNITIVDSDRLCVTNCNRQLMATSRTIGQVKVDALRDRLLEINLKPTSRPIRKSIRQKPQKSSTWRNTTTSSTP